MTFEKIRKIITDQLSVAEDKITLATSVKDDLQADSLDLFQIITDIEDEFNIEIDIDGTEGLETVEDLVKLVDSLLA